MKSHFKLRCGTHALLLLITTLWFSAIAWADDDKRKVILEDDGFNIAQWMVVQSPDADVLGVTVVSGDAWRDHSVARALRRLELAGREDIPVIPGATYPLLNTEERTERWEALYGKLTWKGVWMKEWVEPTEQTLHPYLRPDEVPDLPEGNPSTKPVDEIAANFMIRQVRKYPGEVTIIATGPLTNLALAQRLDPEFATLAKELIYMGGSLNPHQQLDSQSAREFAREFGNSPRREFNFRFDPEAAAIVLRAPWQRIVMVPIDPTTATELTPELIRRLSQADTPIAKFVAGREPGFPLWDEIATGIWLDPDIIEQSEMLYVDVNTEFGPSYGDTLSWAPGYEPGLGERKSEVVKRIHADKLEALMIELMNSPLAKP